MPDTAPRNTRPERSRWQPALRLGAIALGATALIGLMSALTRERVARNESAQVMKVLDTVLLPGSYDNEPHLDRIFVRAPELLGRDEPLPVYRARQGGQPSAAVITAVARQGYIGPIRMLVSIRADGRVDAVRVIAHQETPGLGDGVDVAKSTWIGVFAGRSLQDPPAPRWEVRRDGGEFDALTGATITSRAVIHAVRDAQIWFEQNRDEIFRRPSE